MIKLLLPLIGSFLATELRLRHWRDDDHATGILRDHFNLKLVDRPRRILESRGKEVWRVIAEDGAFALKLRRSDDRQAIVEEAIALDKARRQYPDVPSFQLINETNYALLLISWAEGQSMLQAYRRHPWKAKELGRLFGERQAQLHEMASADGNDSLIHLDFHPANVITDGTGITAVIDWRNAVIGDPRLDLARTWLLLRWTMSSRIVRLFYAEPEKAFRNGWLNGYLKKRGKPDAMGAFIDDALADMQRGQSAQGQRRLAAYADEFRRMVDPSN